MPPFLPDSSVVVRPRLRSHCRIAAIYLAIAFGLATSLWAFPTDSELSAVGMIHDAQAMHASQEEFHRLVVAGEREKAFDLAFEEGDELFATVFNALDGVGANVGQGQRFTRVPRADLSGPGEWADHVPPRSTGPNGQSCNSCHDTPFEDGSGKANSNVHRDPQRAGILASFIERNTPHLFAIGALQRLAEEMTERLHKIRDNAIENSCRSGQPKTRKLMAKGVSFGKITVKGNGGSPCRFEIDTSQVSGVDADLIIRPIQWKGNFLTVREFNRDASNNELGMQAIELVGEDIDGDFDGITNEMTIGDQTALAVYLAAQPRPVTKLELSDLGLIEPLPQTEIDAIRRGERIFSRIDCASCHVPQLRIRDPIFSEPSQNPNYRDSVFPAGQNPVDVLVDPQFPVTFNLTRDQPDNIIHRPDGGEFRLGAFEADSKGRAIVRLYGDLRRHEMGAGLAETIDETGTGTSTWITKELWGVGSTAPYLHDGRATTITEAIFEHSGEAQRSQRHFQQLSVSKQKDLVMFLENLVLFKIEEEE